MFKSPNLTSEVHKQKQTEVQPMETRYSTPNVEIRRISTPTTQITMPTMSPVVTPMATNLEKDVGVAERSSLNRQQKSKSRIGQIYLKVTD